MDSKQGFHIMALSNSIIGVSILAMPYCFKQCGIILSIILLICSSIISRLACHFLLKSAIKAKLKTFEFLAYHAFGSLGKFVIEICMIGFLIGTCIAFFVVMGDLSPQIVAQLMQTPNTVSLRIYILMALAIFCVLPLGLLKNVDSLTTVCTATIGFYACLVLKIMGESAPHLLLGDWYDKVSFWRPAGILQCIPIFSMALFCQTQLFEIYQSIPNASLDKMNSLIRIAVNICTCVYIFVGVFGYIALSHVTNFSGNILLIFQPSFMTEVMKIGFVLSVAFSFPLIIFPCRASLYSLLFKPSYTLHESSVIYIPEMKFKILTFMIVLISCVIGILIPNIELVLGLVGSTIGVMICVLFPATCFIRMTSKNTNERILAQLMLLVGIIVMVLGTYANLYSIDEVHNDVITENINVQHKIDIMITIKDQIDDPKITNLVPPIVDKKLEEEVILNKLSAKIDNDFKEIRHEPPQPEAPDDAHEKPPELPPILTNKPQNLTLKTHNDEIIVAPKSIIKSQNDEKINKIEETKKIIKKSDDVDIDAIKKEENELQEQQKEMQDTNLVLQKQLVEEQHVLIEEQKKLLQEFKIEAQNIKKESMKLEEVKDDLMAVKNSEFVKIEPNLINQFANKANATKVGVITNHNRKSSSVKLDEGLQNAEKLIVNKKQESINEDLNYKKQESISEDLNDKKQESINKDLNDKKQESINEVLVNNQLNLEAAVIDNNPKIRDDKKLVLGETNSVIDHKINTLINLKVIENKSVTDNKPAPNLEPISYQHGINSNLPKLVLNLAPIPIAAANKTLKSQLANIEQNNVQNIKQNDVNLINLLKIAPKIATTNELIKNKPQLIKPEDANVKKLEISKDKSNKPDSIVEAIRRDLLEDVEYAETKKTIKELSPNQLNQLREKRDVEKQCDDKGASKYNTRASLIINNGLIDPKLDSVIKLDAVNLGIVQSNSDLNPVINRQLKNVQD